jgi:hypothetical protein
LQTQVRPSQFVILLFLFRSCTKCPHQSEKSDPKLVQATLAKAKAGVNRIGLVSGKVENVASASDHLQSVPDTIDSFSKILKTFEKFHSVATTLTNVRASSSIVYLADLRT